MGLSGLRGGKKKGQEGYGQGVASIAAGDDVLLDEEAMVEQLLGCIEAPDYQPPSLPSVAMELMGISQRADVEIDEIVALIELDAMIAGRVLALVQSPVYAGAAEIRSLRDALMRVGLKTLRNVVMQIAVNLRVFRSPDYADTMELLRRHSTMTAHLTRIVCKHAELGADEAFLVGLLHDVGIAGTLLALSERKARDQKPPDLVAIWPALDRVHPRAGEIMAERWGLPKDVQRAIANHHQVMMHGQPDPLSGCIAIADDLASENGFGVLQKADGQSDENDASRADCISSHVNVDRSSPKTLDYARQALSLDDDTMEKIRTEAAELDNPFD